MEQALTQISLIVADACNLACRYCFQEKTGRMMAPETAERAVEVFYPRFAGSVSVIFYGGEPLMAAETIRAAVNRLAELNGDGQKEIHYALTTNGTLLTPELLAFMNRWEFSLIISYDGPLHDEQRGPGRRERLEEVFGLMAGYPRIRWRVNTVFTPRSIGALRETLLYILDLGVPGVLYALDSAPPFFYHPSAGLAGSHPGESWSAGDLEVYREQLALLRGDLAAREDAGREVWLDGFEPVGERGKFVCFAGRDRLAVGPLGELWGCFLFYDFFKKRRGSGEYGKYCLGELGAAAEGGGAEYAELRQEFFYTEEGLCADCPDLEECRMCPAAAATASGSPVLGKIPRWFCRAARIKRESREAYGAARRSRRRWGPGAADGASVDAGGSDDG